MSPKGRNSALHNQTAENRQACVYLPLFPMNPNKNTNPKFDFYSKLLTLIQSKGFRHSLAQEVLSIYQANQDEIGLTDVTLDNLELWHGQMHDYRGGKEDDGITKMEEIAISCFEDLATQMRNRSIRLLHMDWKAQAGISGDLFVRFRKTKRLGEGFVTITVVADDESGLKEFLKDPDEFVGEVHFSESSATDSAVDTEAIE